MRQATLLYRHQYSISLLYTRQYSIRCYIHDNIAKRITDFRAKRFHQLVKPLNVSRRDWRAPC